MNKVYALYNNEDRCEMKIETNEIWQRDDIRSLLDINNPNKVVIFNDKYCISYNRKALKDFAKQTKEYWVMKRQNEIYQIEKIKI